MHAKILTSSVAGILLSFAISAYSLQQSTSNKGRAPQLTTEDLKESSTTRRDASPNTESVTRDTHKWHRYSPEELALSIELPGKPVLMGISLLDQPGLKIGPAKAYAYQSEEISVLVFRFAVKESGFSEDDLRAFGVGFLKGLAKRPGVSDVATAATPKGDSTVLLESSYREGSVVFETRGFIHSNGHDVRLVVTKFAQADVPAGELAFRIINSVKIQ